MSEARSPEPRTAICQWCGVRLVPGDGTWTDVGDSGDYCPEGRAIGSTGTSPHLPVLASSSDASPRTDPWTWLHDNDFSWDDVNAIAVLDVERLAQAANESFSAKGGWTHFDDIVERYARLTEAKPETPA